MVETAPTPRAAVAPPGFKFVKVRKADGTIVTVKRKLSPEELAAQAKSTSTTGDAKHSVVTTTDQPAASVTPDGKSAPTATAAPVESSRAISPGAEDEKTRTLSDPDLESALEDQRQHFRERRLTRMKNQFIRGAATVIGAAIPTVDIGHWHDGDEEMHGGDSDFSDDDDDHGDDDHNHEHDVRDDHDHGHGDEKQDHTQNDQPQQVHVGAAASATAAMLTAKAKPEDERAPPPRAAAGAGGKDGKEKVTYAVNVKELDKLEQAHIDDSRPLKRHWANISFYALAALAIILPIMLLILGIFIILMDGKSVKSHWNKMSQPIKIATSAWPIVFAAVVAQVFKTYATWRVERGIKLVRLEQLVGSNSFASAIKQPFLIRRIDTMTLFVFIIWCLSPIGSSALQRVYKEEPKSYNIFGNHTHYLDSTGTNQMLNRQAPSHWATRNGTGQIQLMSYYFTSSFVPPAASEDRIQGASYTSQDRYGNLLIQDPYIEDYDDPAYYTSKYGSPFTVPAVNISAAILDKAADKYQPDEKTSKQRVYLDYQQFDMNTSFFKLSCNDWQSEKYDAGNFARFSMSPDNNIGFGMGNVSADHRSDKPNYLTFASRNRQDSSAANASTNTLGSFSVIECTYSRVTLTSGVVCRREVNEGELPSPVPSCYTDNNNDTLTVDPFDTVTNDTLADFSAIFIAGTSAVGSSGSNINPIERFISGKLLDDPYNRTGDAEIVNLSQQTTSAGFAKNFGYLFNTFTSLGYCPGCIDAAPDRPIFVDRLPLYKQVDLDWYALADKVYKTNRAWVATYMVCCILLILAGTAGVWLESITIAPDVLGYASNVARNNRYLHMPKVSSQMTGGERLRKTGNTEVMMQDVKANADVGKIALGMKHDDAHKLRPGRVYR